jgi:hypothetical protein
MSHGIPQVDEASLGAMGSLMRLNESVPPDLVAKCRRAGEALLHTQDASSWGWTTLVACAAAEWKVDEALRLSEQAIRALGEDPALLCNLAVSFKHLSRVDLAARFSALAFQHAPQSEYAVKCHLDDLFFLGQISDGLRIARVASERDFSGDGNGTIEGFLTVFQRASDDLQRASVDERQLQFELSAALQVMADAKQRYDQTTLECEEDPEDRSSSMYVEIRFLGSFEDEMALGAALAPRLAQLPGWDPCRLNTGFKYMLPERASVAV